MSYANFKPDIWSTFLLQARDKITVAKSLCWGQFQGDIQKAGDTVHVMGLSGATVKNVPKDADGNFTDIDSPESLDDASLDIKADQMRYMNFKVDDIDKLQAQGDIMSAVQNKSSKNYGLSQDAYIYSVALANAPSANILDFTGTTKLTCDNILDVIGQAQAIIEDGASVVNDGDISAEVDPFTFMKFKKAFVKYGQPNQDAIASGYSGNWFGTKLYHTNSLPVVSASTGDPVPHNTDGAIHYIIFRTKEAISFVEKKQLNLEAYRPEKGFSDAMKGFGIFGAKITRPSDIVIAKCVLGTDAA